MSSSKNIKGLNLMRLLACVAVFLYHLNILKGGYLAVCSFFVLTGYLSCKSALSNKEFSIKKYYKSKLKRLYIPLLFVVFISIIVITNIKDIAWVNIKQETISTLLGYNNFWQLKANLNYFTKVISSPFMHLWYIAIILQYYLLFPFIYKALNKLKEKTSSLFPIILIIVLSIISFIYFIILSKTNLMSAYYNTFSRIFSILLGMSLAFINEKNEYHIPKLLKEKPLGIVISIIYFETLINLYIFIPSTDKYIYVYMLLSTIITLRLIDYLTYINSKSENIFDKVIKYLSKLTYAFYLIQYPVIFIFQYININYKILLITLITLTISIIINLALDCKNKIIRYITLSILTLVSLYGAYIFIICKDYSKEMKNLEKELAKNEEMVKQSQEEFMANQQSSEEAWEELLNSYSTKEEEIKAAIDNLPIVAVGDSVMLGAAPNIKQTFKNGYVDAKISRTAWVVNDILVDLKNKNMLNGPIILHLGTNGDCAQCRKEIMETCKGKDVFWLTITNDQSIHFNGALENFAENYDNLHIIDWNTISKGHSEYFVADKIHLTEKGREAYAKVIYDAISDYYLNKITEEKEQLIEEHEAEELAKVTFIGNDLLINDFKSLKENYQTSNFVLDKNFTYETVYNKIKEMKDNNSLTKKMVLAFDSSLKLTKEEYQTIIDLCQDNIVYVVLLSNEYKLDNSLNFYEQIKDNYLMPDKIHLTDAGNTALTKIITDNITAAT